MKGAPKQIVVGVAIGLATLALWHVVLAPLVLNATGNEG